MRMTGYLVRERTIARAEHGGIEARWRYGRALLEAKHGRRQLPHGMIDSLIRAATEAGLSVSRREIQHRIRCAEVYATEGEVRTAVRTYGSWTTLREAAFPAVEIGETAERLGLVVDLAQPEPEVWTQDALGDPALFPDALRVARALIPLSAATLRNVEEFLDECDARTARHATVNDRRRARYEQLLAAVGGCRDVRYSDAVRAAEIHAA
jgi:hypothetical protein